MYGKYKRERKKITDKLSNQIKIYKKILLHIDVVYNTHTK